METPTAADARKESSVSPKRVARIHRTAEALLIYLCALTFCGVLVSFLGARSYRWRGFDLEVSVRPAVEGATRLVFAPLGDIRAETHKAPVELSVALKGISFEEAKKLALNPPPREELEKDFERTARSSVLGFAMTQLMLGTIGALLIPLIARSRKIVHWVGSGTLGAGAVGLCFAQMAWTYSPRAFETPTYTGSLREAGWIIGLAKDGFARADALSDRLKRVAANVSALYGRIDATLPLSPEDEDVTRVLHISDIHNNSAAIEFVTELAERTGVDMVIDTGDLTDLGVPLENELLRGLSRLSVPYLFVAGNHDSQVTVGAVRGFRGARVLDGEVVNEAGLEVLGLPDPSSSRPAAGSVDTPESALKAEGDALLSRVNSLARPPDIAAVHNPRMAESLIGRVPVILCGHMHRAEVLEEQETVICNAGTTGGAGVRYFDRTGGVPFTAAILGFIRNPEPKLAYIDQVTLDGSLGQYSITRRSFNRKSEESTSTETARSPK